jgi:hypothetical protein
LLSVCEPVTDQHLFDLSSARTLTSVPTEPPGSVLTVGGVVAIEPMLGLAAGRVRDLSLIPLPDGSQLVIACDSVGGIGPRKDDTVAATAYTTGFFAVRTPLLELLCAGAFPHLIVNTLCFESGPQADEMVRAIVEVAAGLGLPRSAVTGSTEDNVRTTTTGIGITVIGSVTSGGLRTGRSRAGDLVACLGLPRSAPQFVLTPGDPELPTVEEVSAALAISLVREALPVGSRGIAHELASLADTAGLHHRLTDPLRPRSIAVPTVTDRHRGQGDGLDVLASGGPASCVLVSLDPAALPALRSIRADLPVTVVGELFSASPR